MNKKRIVIILLIGLLIILGVSLYEFVKPYYIYPDVQNAETEVTISSKELIMAFQKDENIATKRYREKVIEVDGIVKEVTFLNNRNTVILYGTNNYTNVLCDMALDQSEAIKNLKPDQHIKIKGVCKGFLKDAIVLNCILIKTLTDE